MLQNTRIEGKYYYLTGLTRVAFRRSSIMVNSNAQAQAWTAPKVSRIGKIGDVAGKQTPLSQSSGTGLSKS